MTASNRVGPVSRRPGNRRAERIERLRKSEAIILRPTGLIFTQIPRINASGEQGVTLEVRGLQMGSLETRMYPMSMFGKLPFACFRLSEQSNMFLELILPG